MEIEIPSDKIHYLVERSPILIDTCAILDMVNSKRERHGQAREFLDFLHSENIKIKTSVTALIEATVQTKRTIKEQGDEAFIEGEIFKEGSLDLIYLDKEFIEEAFMPDLPYIKTGDYIFLCIANKYKWPLITEDRELGKKAGQAGLLAFTMQEYLDMFNKPEKPPYAFVQ